MSGRGSARALSHSALTGQKGNLRPREGEEYAQGDSANTLQSWDLNPCHSALETRCEHGSSLQGHLCLSTTRWAPRAACQLCK